MFYSFIHMLKANAVPFKADIQEIVDSLIKYLSTRKQNFCLCRRI